MFGIDVQQRALETLAVLADDLLQKNGLLKSDAKKWLRESVWKTEVGISSVMEIFKDNQHRNN
jgi:hypothetical protein